MNSTTTQPHTGKEKKTRRRLRLSCVECTKRRQRCDRKYPCGLCVSRGVSHLCRWETVPVARPPPQRPPHIPKPQASADSEPSMAHLIARIATLEKSLQEQTMQNLRYAHAHNEEAGQARPSAFDVNYPDFPSLFLTDFSPHNSEMSLQSPSTRSCYSSPEPLSQEDDSEPIFSITALSQDTYETASTLSQLSVAHHGEYVGRGTSLDALHSISKEDNFRFFHAKSAESTSINSKVIHQLCPAPSTTTLLQLVHNLPPMAVASSLLKSFFLEVNWRFGIPEHWFQKTFSQVYTFLQYPDGLGTQINANWLALFFAILALAPRDHSILTDNSVEDAEHHYMYSTVALRIADNNYLNRPYFCGVDSAADGTVLSCLAAPLLCNYLADRGHLSEAWKMAGHWTRAAQAIGLHRDSGWREWQAMSEEDKLLRRRAWWGLVIWDKMYSYILGRPQMTVRDSHDVAMPLPTNTDGTRNAFDLYQTALIQLSNLAGEAMEKCFSIHNPTGPSVYELDIRFEQWEAHLPHEFRQISGHGSSPHVGDNPDGGNSTTLARQRHTLATYYLICRMKLHLALITNKEAFQFLGVYGPTMSRKRSRGICIAVAMDLVRLQCDAHDAAITNGSFEISWSLFDAAVTLVCVLTQHPWQDRPHDAEPLIERTIGVFSRMLQIGSDGGDSSDTARIAVTVLSALAQEQGWKNDMANLRGGTPPMIIPSPMAQESFDSQSVYHSPSVSPHSMHGYEWSSPTSITPTGIFDSPSHHSVNLVHDHSNSIPRYNMNHSMSLSYDEVKVEENRIGGGSSDVHGINLNMQATPVHYR